MGPASRLFGTAIEPELNRLLTSSFAGRTHYFDHRIVMRDVETLLGKPEGDRPPG